MTISKVCVILFFFILYTYLIVSLNLSQILLSLDHKLHMNDIDWKWPV
jgi:hypothetical protein